MRLVADNGLWSTGFTSAPTPLVAVLEVSGAVLSWTVDDQDSTAPCITFTDPSRADWLWRIVGESGHLAIASAASQVQEPQSVELPAVDILPGSADALRRLAVGHWLRRWWPASRRDGIAGLDRALLDAEVALLTSAAHEFFTDDTLDSDIAELLAPHAAALEMQARSDDRRIRDLARAGVELADELELEGNGWPELCATLDDSSYDGATRSARQDDYALAAGSEAASGSATGVARGVASIAWSAVPPRIFDAGEDTVQWSVQADGTSVAVAWVQGAVIGPDPAAGIPVVLRSGTITGTGTMDADGRATLLLVDAHARSVSESAAWNHDWAATSVFVGGPLSDATESPQMRERIRRWTRARLARPPSNAFLAEVLAGESDY